MRTCFIIGQNEALFVVRKKNKAKMTSLNLFFSFFDFHPEFITNYVSNFQVGSADPKLSGLSGTWGKPVKSSPHINFYKGTSGN